MRDYVHYYKNEIKTPDNTNIRNTENFSTFKFVTPYSPNNSKFNKGITPSAAYELNSSGYLRSKIYLRASILICHYFEHIRFLFKKRPDSTTKGDRVMNCYIKRETSHVITLTKAPLAHKKFSREQYYFKYYIYIFQYKDVLKLDSNTMTAKDVLFINSSLTRLLRAMGTNLFFLQSCHTFYFFNSDVLI